MKSCSWGRWSSFILSLMPVLAGCEVRSFQVSTRIESDGSIHREIYQPLDNTLPPEALDDEQPATTSTQPASRPAAVAIGPAWRAKWHSFKVVDAPPETSGGAYFKATGDFETVDDVPPSYYRPAAPLPERASENALGHMVDDYHLFAIEHWEEDITETVSLPEYVSAAGEFSRLVLPPLQKAFTDLYGAEYQLKDFNTYLKHQLSAAFCQYCLWYYQYHPLSVDDLPEQGVRDLKSAFALMDVELPVTKQAYVDLDTWPASIEQSAVQILRRTVRHKGGQELSEDDATDLWDQIQDDLGVDFSDEEGDSGEVEGKVHRTSRGRRLHSRRVQEEAPESRPRLIEALQKHMEEMNGSDGQMQLVRLEVQLGGAHHNSPINRLGKLFGSGPLLGGLTSFEYTLETSGPIVETNAVRLADNKARWRFTSEELFPDGMSMSARSVRWNRPAERRLFGKTVLRDVGTVAHLLDLIEPDGPVEQALADAVKTGTLKPIEELLKDEDATVRAAARTIMELRSGTPNR